MSNLPNSFVAAGVVPNHVRYTNIDTSQEYIIDIPSYYLIAFTFDSVIYFSKELEYQKLITLAEAILEKSTGNNQVVIEITGKKSNGELVGNIFLYAILSNEGRNIGLHKKHTISIPVNSNLTADIIESNILKVLDKL